MVFFSNPIEGVFNNVQQDFTDSKEGVILVSLLQIILQIIRTIKINLVDRVEYHPARSNHSLANSLLI
jgi:hypothetical protein